MNSFKTLCAAVCGLALFSAFAADYVDWTGESGGNYMEATNWTVRGTETHRVPTTADIIVFNPGSGVSLSVACTGTLGDSSGPERFHEIRVESGAVTLTSSTYIGYSGKANCTNEIYVAEGATFAIQFPIYARGTCSLRKTGGGKVSLNTKSYWRNSGNKWQTCFVDEGTLWTTFYSGNFDRFYKFVVANGATLQRTSYPNPADSAVTYEIQKGARFEWSNSGGLACRGVYGDGDIEFTHVTSGTYTLAPSLVGGPYRFGGTMHQGNTTYNLGFQNCSGSTTATESERHFIIDRSDAFLNLASFCAAVQPDFGRGIGEFYLPPIFAKNGAKFVLEDEDGEPIRLHAGFCENSSRGYGSKTVVMEGAGDWFVRTGTAAVTGEQIRVTGTIGTDSGATLKLGNGTAAGDVTNMPFAAIENLGTLIVTNAGAATYAGRLTGSGVYNLYSPLTIGNLDANLLVNTKTFNVCGTTVTVTGGQLTAPLYYSVYIKNGGTLRLSGAGTVFKGTRTDEDKDLFSTKRDGYLLLEGSKDATLEIADGALLQCGEDYKSYLPDVRLLNGGTLFVRDGNYWYCAKDATQQTLYSDGGILRLFGLENLNTAPFPYDGSKWVAKVGPGGLEIRYDESTSGRWIASMIWYDNLKTETADGLATDGGVILNAPGRFELGKPQNVKGPFVLRDGRATIYPQSEGNCACGSGDLVFNGGWLTLQSNLAEEKTVRFASDAGAKGRIRSSSRLDLSAVSGSDYAKRTQRLDFVFGPDDAAEPSLVSENGAALYVIAQAGDAIDGTGKTRVLSKGGVETHADGRTKAPIVLGAGSGQAQLATYDATLGLVAFTNYVTFAQADSEKAVQVGWTEGTNPTVTLPAGETKIGALRMALPYVSKEPTLVSIPAGATLKVGNGTDPAVIAVAPSISSNYRLFDGAGTLDFGTSRGVFASGTRANYMYTRQGAVRTKISGSGGVTFSAATGVRMEINYTDNVNYCLTAANDYTGGTIVDMAAVRVTDPQAFSTGPVRVLGGKMFGGAVCFAHQGPFANDFTIGGYGRRATDWGSLAQAGALEAFTAGVRITGDVIVAEPARIGAPQLADGTEAFVFEGRVSGQRLEIFSGVQRYNDSKLYRMTVAFTQDNASLTGGVKVLQSKVVLRGANPTLGTGEILLDRSTLRFENTAALVTTNAIAGKTAVIELAGEKEVLFAGDYSRLESVTNDLCGLRHEFSVIPPFANWTSTGGRATIAITGEETVVWPTGLTLDDPKNFDLEIAPGARLDLGGQTLTVRRAVEGAASRVTNGTLVETRPAKGMMFFIK